MKKAIIVSGYFNPLHKAHIEYFKLSKTKGDILIVIVNNDIQRELKQSKEFMSEDERCLIISELKLVDIVYKSIDVDRTVKMTLELIHKELSSKFSLSFANGGDQNNNTIPEKSLCEKLGISLIDGLGDKVQSSSWILKNKNEN